MTRDNRHVQYSQCSYDFAYRDHSFNTYAKFSEKANISLPWIRTRKILVFRKILRTF